jgi:hypothetical protein
METQTLTRAPLIAAELIEVDSAIAALQTRRYCLLAEMRTIHETE